MRNQAARDEQTVTIAIALAIVIGGLVLCGLTVAGLNAVADVPDRALGMLGFAILGLSGLMAVVYLFRNRRP